LGTLPSLIDLNIPSPPLDNTMPRKNMHRSKQSTRRLGSVYGGAMIPQGFDLRSNELESNELSNQSKPPSELPSDDLTFTTARTPTTSSFHYLIKFRLKLENIFESSGEKVANSKQLQIILLTFIILVSIVCGSGMVTATTETSIVKLWTESGGRLEVESQYINKWKGTGKMITTDIQQKICTEENAKRRRLNNEKEVESVNFSEETSDGGGSVEIMIVTPKIKSTDMISNTILEEHYQLLIDIADMEICVDTKKANIVPCPDSSSSTTTNIKSFSWTKNLCSKISPPNELKEFTPFVPCNRATVFDCFKEGNFDWSSGQLSILPRLLERNDGMSQILVNDYGFVGYDKLPSIYNTDTNILHQAVTGGCYGFATKIPLMRWHESMIIGNPKKKDGQIVHADAFQSIFLLAKSDDILKREDISKNIANLVINEWKSKFVNLTYDQKLSNDQRKYKNLKISVLLSNALTDILRDTAGNNTYLTIIGVFIMIIFVVFSLMDLPCTTSKCGCGSSLMGLVGIVLVLLATISAFGFTSWLNVSFNPTSIQVLPFLALGLGVDDVFIVISCWSNSDRLGLLLKMNLKEKDLIKDPGQSSKYISKLIGRVFSRAGPSITMTSLSNFVAFLIGSMIPIPAVSSFCIQASAVVAFNYVFVMFGICIALTWFELYNIKKNDKKNTKMWQLDNKDDKHHQSRFDHCIEIYADIILHPLSKILIIVLFLIFFTLSIIYINEVKDGLDIDDIVPKGTPVQLFLDDKTTYFSSFDATIVTKEMNYPCKQKELLQFVNSLKLNKWVTYVEEPWLELYIKFMKSKNRTNNDGYIPSTDFYKGLDDWDKDIGSSLDVLSAGKTSFGVNNDGKLMFTQIKFTVDGLNSTNAYASMIKSVRNTCTNASKNGVHVFPEGIPFLFWEQYISLRSNFWQGLTFIFIALIIFIMPFVVNPIASLIIVGIISMIILECFGIMGMLDIKFSAIPAVSLLMSVGISVEFVAHFVLTFLMEFDGNQNDRVRITFLRMMPPVLQGGLSTFCSIILLAFSEFEFVRKYFFLPFLSVCVVGLINGLILLPVILSLIGPTAIEFCPTGCCCSNKETKPIRSNLAPMEEIEVQDEHDDEDEKEEESIVF
jgi:predicted RND superfamily exporter protein